MSWLPTIAALGVCGVVESGVLDRGAPYFLVDYYHGDFDDKPAPIEAVVAAPHFVGAIIKVTDGIAGPNDKWARTEWQRVRAAGGSRYGTSWFRGAYHYLRTKRPGAQQADHYLDLIESAGGWGPGDIVPAMDIEKGSSGDNATNVADVVRCAHEFTARIRERTGMPTMNYARGAMRDLKINDKLGCDRAWNAAYTYPMETNGLLPRDPGGAVNSAPGPFTLDDIVLWQYCGDGDSAHPTYPNGVAGFGKEDISVFLDGARKPTLARLRERLLRKGPQLGELAVAVGLGAALAWAGGVA